jgi:glycine cleavage system regulatory protein
MARSLVVTLVAQDAPGIVDRVSSVVRASGGNWEESRMSRLSGFFAGILRVTLPPSQIGTLKDGLAAIEVLTVDVHDAGDATGREHVREVAARVSVVGNDRAGIVEQIFGALASLGVNVEELETERSDAPYAGSTLFHARASLCLPEGVDTDDVAGALEDIAPDLMVDVERDS